MTEKTSITNCKKYNIIYVCPYNPVIATKGPQGPKNVSQPFILAMSSIADVHLIVICKEKDFNQVKSEELFKNVLSITRVEPLNYFIKNILKFAYLISLQPPALADGFAFKLKSEIINKINWADIIHLDYFTLTNYANFFSNLKTTYIYGHDAYSIYQKRMYVESSGIINKIKSFVRYFLFKRLELSWYKKSTRVMVVSNDDCIYLNKLGANNVFHLPPILSNNSYLSFNRNTGGLINLLIPVPNNFEEARVKLIISFIKNFLPKIKEKFNIKVTLLGGVAAEVAKLSLNNDIEVINYVENYLEFLGSRNWIYLYPVRVGAGIHTKLLEIMALQIPVVGYDEILNPLGGSNGETYFSASNENEFYLSVMNLINSFELRNFIGKNAKNFIKQKYSEEYVKKIISLDYNEQFVMSCNKTVGISNE